MSTINTTNVEEIYTEILKHVGLRTYTDLAKLLGVKYPTLMRWKERGNVADVSPFVEKIPTINVKWLTTGEGPMLRDQNKQETIHQKGIENISVRKEEKEGQGTVQLEAVLLLNQWVQTLDIIDRATLLNDLMDGLPEFSEWIKKRKGKDTQADIPQPLVGNGK